ncbi:MAG: hypothetical protein E6G34_13570 [Actinobacteria bacterium]|nr:MAG: hypothetical protein E6G34_13570 [Actinomycetota bacterium]
MSALPLRLRAKSTSVAATLALLLLAALALASCGGSSGNGIASKTPTEILALSKQAADSANSVHVAGSIVSKGSPLTLDLFLLAGKGARGRLSEGGSSFELIETGGTVYLRGSAAFYRRIGGAAAAQLLNGKWLKAPASTPSFASLGSLTDLRRLIDSTLADHGTLAKGATTSVNGQRVVGLNDTSKGGTLYVAATGKPYPIQIARTGANGGRVIFDRWNAPVSLTAPSGAIDITQLQGPH